MKRTTPVRSDYVEVEQRNERDRSSAEIGKPAVLNGVRPNHFGKEVKRSFHVDDYQGQQSFELDGFKYRVISTEKSGFHEQDNSSPLWTMGLANRNPK